MFLTARVLIMEPSVIRWWDKATDTIRTSRKVFYTEEEVSEYYKHMRNRINSLMVVVPLADLEKQSKQCKLFGGCGNSHNCDEKVCQENKIRVALSTKGDN